MTTLVTIDLDKLRADLAAARADVARLEALESAAIVYGKASVNGKNGHSATAGKSPVNVLFAELDGKTVHEAAHVVLSKAGRAMKTREIVDALEAAKFGTQIANLQASVFTGLDRKKDLFRKVKPGVWALATEKQQEDK